MVNLNLLIVGSKILINLLQFSLERVLFLINRVKNLSKVNITISFVQVELVTVLRSVLRFDVFLEPFLKRSVLLRSFGSDEDLICNIS